MNAVLSLLILAAGSPVTNDLRHPDAVEVFHCDFSEDWDANFDQWPDHWKRKRGPEFPRYLKIAIETDPTASANKALKIELDGGAVTVSSPLVGINWLFSYVLEGRIKTVGMTHDRAYVTITFYDSNDTPL